MRPLVVLVAVLLPLPALADIQFRHPLDDQPVTVPMPEGEQLTPAVRVFRQTGEDPYIGRPQAVAEGKALYDEWCQSCHLPDGSGRMGPSFLDNDWNYPRSATAVGKFEVIWEGATGAMQAFKDRLTQDQVLKIIAHIEALRGKASPGEEKAEAEE